jgi:uncharacterized protein YktA (UPF0223 family)
MKEFTFHAWCNYGKGDTGESWIDVELTDEEAERLITYSTKAEIYYEGFHQCEELKDLYDRIYNIAVAQMTEELRAFGDLDEKYANDPNWKIDDLYGCGVNFPEEFEELLTSETKRIKKH